MKFNLLFEVKKYINNEVQNICGKTTNSNSIDRIQISELPKYIQRLLISTEPSLATDKILPLDHIPRDLAIDLHDAYPSEEIAGGRYLVSPQNKPFFAVKVKNSSGTTLPKEEWTCYTIATPDDTLPPELSTWLDKKSINNEERHISLSPEVDAVVSSHGLTIFQAGDRDNVLLFEPSIVNRDGNFVVRPGTPLTLYYIPPEQPSGVTSIVLNMNPSDRQALHARFPENSRYSKITNLSIDPTGSFFVFESENVVNIIAIDTLESVGQIPNASFPSFDQSGRLAVISKINASSTDSEKTFKYYEIDFAPFAQKRKAAQQQRIVQGLSLNSLFMSADERAAKNAAQKAQEVQPIVDGVMPEFQQKADEILQSRDVSKVASLESALVDLNDELRRKMPGQNESAYVIDTIRLNVIEPLKRELYKDEAATLLAKVQTDLQESLSLSVINFLNQGYQRLDAMTPFLEDSQRRQVVRFGRELQKKTSEFMAVHSDEFIQQAESVVKGAEQKLQAFTSKSEMDEWMDYEMPAILKNLGILHQQCPPEATTALASIVKSRSDLVQLAETYEKKFKREYATIREKAAEKTGEMGRLIYEDTQRLIERVKDKQFSSRKDAENYVSLSQTYKQIINDIDVLKQIDPDKAKKLYRYLEVQLSYLYYAIYRNSGKQIASTGQQIVFFGETKFPIWEGKVKQRGQRKADVIFVEDKSSHGPGVTADKVLGDISIRITDGDGKESVVRLFQELEDENEYRYGFEESRGEQIPPSYLTGRDYRNFKRDLADWEKGSDKSLVYMEYLARRQKLRDLYNTRPKRNQFSNDSQGESDWKGSRESWDIQNKQSYENLLKEYAQYCREHNVSLLRRIDQVKNAPDVEHINGKGYIPEWQSHWVVDPQTEHYLEDMAQTLGMQSELQEGMLLLKGHAGTGKDVLVKMFCEKTHRPYFAIDCTKWTTEFELSEDIVLESVNGASQTMKVPSVVLNAITTPGAVMYFNELNAMPEQSQMFLHSLLDEKRSLTLKTSSGETIKADPNVLIIGSMNPGYPGTFAPQFATRSRTVAIDVDYPPLLREPDKADPNQITKPISVSEALRIARGITSLQDMTYEMDPSRNEFVKMWDKYVNRIDTGAPDPTPEQKFDIETILALVEFGNELREHFIATFENQKNTKSGDKVLEVRQPITSREMRRCAYALSKMSVAEKVAKNPEDTARDLLARYFLSHLDDVDARTKLELHINTNMHSQKRMAP